MTSRIIDERQQQMILLPYNYIPGSFDVICARGKGAKNYIGNKYFQSLIKASIKKYSQATTRIEKSMIVSDIINVIRQKSSSSNNNNNNGTTTSTTGAGAGFIKNENGQWYDVGDHLAREKVGQSLRNLLHGQYKSSTKAKKQRRNTKMYKEIEEKIQTNKVILQRMKKLSDTLQMKGPHVSDHYVTMIMTQANCDLLTSFKKDESFI